MRLVRWRRTRPVYIDLLLSLFFLCTSVGTPIAQTRRCLYGYFFIEGTYHSYNGPPVQTDGSSACGWELVFAWPSGRVQTARVLHVTNAQLTRESCDGHSTDDTYKITCICKDDMCNADINNIYELLEREIMELHGTGSADKNYYELAAFRLALKFLSELFGFGGVIWPHNDELYVTSIRRRSKRDVLSRYQSMTSSSGHALHVTPFVDYPEIVGSTDWWFWALLAFTTAFIHFLSWVSSWSVKCLHRWIHVTRARAKETATDKVDEFYGSLVVVSNTMRVQDQERNTRHKKGNKKLADRRKYVLDLLVKDNYLTKEEFENRESLTLQQMEIMLVGKRQRDAALAKGTNG